MKLQKLLSYVRRACDDYNMIEEGDKIAVGISGGKDSLTLLVALKHLQRFYPKKFDVMGITVSLGLPGFDLSPVHELCDGLSIPYTVVETDIGEVVFDTRNEKNPCSLCAKMRKGALNDEAVAAGCNKIALGHNKDDVIHTFMMSLFYEGRINVFSPVTHWDRTGLYAIRPLAYVPENEVRSFVKNNNITIVKSPCPVDGRTKREEMRKLAAELSKTYKNLDNNIFGAIQRAGVSGWEKRND